MKKNISLIGILTITCILLTLSGCTTNPISENNEIADISALKGKITLSDNSTPENIFIWMKDTDIFARTEENGEFQLQLPPKSMQVGNGMTGIYKLYFYLSNFDLDSAEVFLRDGVFIPEQGDIDKNGELLSNIVLRKLLSINGQVDRETISSDYIGDIWFNFTLSTHLNTPVLVNVEFLTIQNIIIPPPDPEALMNKKCTDQIPEKVFIRNDVENKLPVDTLDNLNNKQGQLYTYNIVTKYLLDKATEDADFPLIVNHPDITSIAGYTFDVSDISPVELVAKISWPPAVDRTLRTYEPDRYRLYLYLLITNTDLPDGLEEQINKEFGKEYIHYPINNNYVSFEVRD